MFAYDVGSKTWQRFGILRLRMARGSGEAAAIFVWVNGLATVAAVNMLTDGDL